MQSVVLPSRSVFVTQGGEKSVRAFGARRGEGMAGWSLVVSDTVRDSNIASFSLLATIEVTMAVDSC